MTRSPPSLRWALEARAALGAPGLDAPVSEACCVRRHTSSSHFFLIVGREARARALCACGHGGEWLSCGGEKKSLKIQTRNDGAHSKFISRMVTSTNRYRRRRVRLFNSGLLMGFSSPQRIDAPSQRGGAHTHTRKGDNNTNPLSSNTAAPPPPSPFSPSQPCRGEGNRPRRPPWTRGSRICLPGWTKQ